MSLVPIHSDTVIWVGSYSKCVHVAKQNSLKQTKMIASSLQKYSDVDRNLRKHAQF